MDTFVWSSLFETGIAEVDQQHRELVDLVNQLSADTDSGNPERIDGTLGALVNYTQFHFGCEEKIMTDAGVAEIHAGAHRGAHQRFISQVGQWIEQRQHHKTVPLHQLLEALSNWLIFHILGEDQAMARQIAAIKSGAPPQTAFERDHASDDPRTDILLSAMRHLYSNLERRNEDLQASQKSLSRLNATLEQRVEERTRQLAEVNRMEALGNLAGGIAHEINTPTQYVSDNLTFLKENIDSLLDFAAAVQSPVKDGMVGEQAARKLADLDLDYLKTELPASAEQALQGARQIAKIVQAIKEYCYPTSKTNAPVDINHLVELVATVTRNQWKYVSEIELDLDRTLPKIMAVEGEINQVLVNLIVNAAQAIAEKKDPSLGRITVRTKGDADKVEISVTDTGTGIAPENLNHVFEMFFTTKPPGQGTGQGLAITEAIIRRHGGRIAVTSQPGQGATFTLWLPSRDKQSESDG